MADLRKLIRFDVEGSGLQFTLQIEDDGGNTLELQVSRDQLDVIVDTLDDILLHDDSADEAGS